MLTIGCEWLGFNPLENCLTTHLVVMGWRSEPNRSMTVIPPQGQPDRMQNRPRRRIRKPLRGTVYPDVSQRRPVAMGEDARTDPHEHTGPSDSGRSTRTPWNHDHRTWHNCGALHPTPSRNGLYAPHPRWSYGYCPTRASPMRSGSERLSEDGGSEQPTS